MEDRLVPGRFIDYMSSVADGEIDPVVGTYPGIENARWFDSARFPICRELEQRFQAIAKEIADLPGEVFFPDSERDAVPRRGNWETLTVYAMGHRYEEAARLLPTTVGLIENFGGVTTMGGGAFVSRLPPGASIESHRGPTNTRVRCHLGIDIPSGDCGIEVGGEVRGWTEGRCLMLNDHLPHRVWNHTDEERVVLVLDVWHPELTAVERTLLEGLHVYSSVQAEPITKWLADFRSVRLPPTVDINAPSSSSGPMTSKQVARG